MQENDRWCWAGSLQAVLAYAGFYPRQCDIVSIYNDYEDYGRGHGDCCVLGPKWASDCYHGGYSDGYPPVLGHFGIPSYLNSTVPLGRDDINWSIRYNNPIIIRLDWENGGAHAVVIHGFTASNMEEDLVHIVDPGPSWGYQVITYNALINGGYGDSGYWDRSVFPQIGVPPPKI